MKHLFHSVFVLLLLFAGTLTASAQYVTVDFDKQADFTRYKTYAWAIGTPAKIPALAQRIVDGIDSRLAAKGLRRVEATASPDLIVLYHAAGDTKVQVNTANSGEYNWGRRWDGRPDEPTTADPNYKSVELAVDIGDAKTRKLLWLGSGIDFRERNQSLTERQIDKILDKMFKKFPPKVK